MIASYADFGVEYATSVTSPGVVVNGVAVALGDEPGVADEPVGAADDPLDAIGVDGAHADAPGEVDAELVALELGALVTPEVGLGEAPVFPAQAVTKSAPMRIRAPKRAPSL